MSQLELYNLSVDFPTFSRFNLKISELILNKGEVLGIVGESGSGKSLTAKAIMNLLPRLSNVRSGEILFKNENGIQRNLLDISENEMLSYRGNHISMIFQDPMTSLNPSMRCGEQIQEVLKLHLKMSSRNSKRMVIKLLEKVKLPEPDQIILKYPHELSGGQQQRVMIAMAISTKPSILIADEPTTALDVTVQKQILELLLELKKEYNLSIIFISHDLGVISSISDRIVVMKDGEIVETGQKVDIIQNPQENYTKALIACRPSMNTSTKKLPTISDMNVNQEQKEHRELSGRILLSVENLEKRYIKKKRQQPFLALDNISFKLYEGETLGLIGESGSGKTTIGRSIMQLIHNEAGRIYFKGESISEFRRNKLKEFRKNVQIIFQDPYSSLNPKITIGRIIEEPLVAHAIGNQKDRISIVNHYMNLVHLDPSFINRYPHELSGGQRQRVGIARAIILEPEVLICDESVSALDLSIQAEILNLLNELKENLDLSILFISHDMSIVKFMSDRIIVLKDGQIAEQGPSDELFIDPKTEYTKSLIDSIPE